MRRTVIGIFFLCSMLLLTACGPGKAEMTAAVQSALKQAGEMEGVAVTIETTSTVKLQDGTEDTSQSTRTFWRDGENTLLEFTMPTMNGEKRSGIQTALALVDGVTYQKTGQEWQETDTVPDAFSWEPQSDVPSDAKNYTIEKENNAFVVKLTDEALKNQVQQEIEQAKALEEEMRAEGRDAEANAQAVLIENWGKSRFVLHEIKVSVDEAQTATACTSHLVLEGYGIESKSPGEFVSGEPMTTELTVKWEITGTDKNEIAAKISEAVAEIKG